ncbi:MAG: tetratricopeptide repeat protein [Planctomycetota bacterium]
MSRREESPAARGAGMGRPPGVASFPVTCSAAPLAAFLITITCIVTWAAPASASHSELREAGERYAANDPRAALAVLGEVIGRKGKTAWVAEALYLRARILERDLEERARALRDLRLLTVSFAGTEAAAFGQFSIARIYEEGGLVADAYREHTLCSRLRGIPDGRRAGRSRAARPLVQSGRVTPEGAAELVRLAAERSALLFGRVPPGGVAAGAGLPPRTFVATGPACTLQVPADPRGKPASGQRSDVWYVAAPFGKSITGVTARLEAVVDPAAAGPDDAKFYRMLVERLPRRAGGALVLHGTRMRPEELRGQLALPDGAAALRVTVLRSGARVIRCRMDVDVRDAPPARPKSPGAPKGFAFAVPPGGAGAGGADIARAGGRIFLVWHSPGAGASAAPTEHADLYISSSPDGATWTDPARLPVSSAMDDRGPSLGCLRGGRMLLAWTSDRRGPGTSDIYHGGPERRGHTPPTGGLHQLGGRGEGVLRRARHEVREDGQQDRRGPRRDGRLRRRLHRGEPMVEASRDHLDARHSPQSLPAGAEDARTGGGLRDRAPRRHRADAGAVARWLAIDVRPGVPDPTGADPQVDALRHALRRRRARAGRSRHRDPRPRERHLRSPPPQGR